MASTFSHDRQESTRSTGRSSEWRSGPPPSNFRKQRNSILVAAGDALGLNRQRKRSSKLPPPSQPQIIDEVLEISARQVEEDAERERLRDAAAQAVGLGTTTVEDSSSTYSTGPQTSTAAANTTKSTARSVSPLPSYPATLTTLQPLFQHSGTLLKYVTPSSAFSLLSKSRHWKVRHLALTCIRPIGDQGTTEAHLHLFKSSASDEKEQERLLIHQDSAVYTTDEHYGVKYCVKVEGRLVLGSSTMPYKTSWLLQMPDLDHMQRWIGHIKTAVLMQRAESAGLGSTIYHHTYNAAGPELRGDMDVMLSLGKQGLLPAPPTEADNWVQSAKPPQQSDDSNPSVRSKHSTTSPTSGAVMAFKGLFNGRPISRQFSVSGNHGSPPPQSTSHTTQPSIHSIESNATVPVIEDSIGTARQGTFSPINRPSSPLTSPTPASIISPLSSPHTTSISEDVLLSSPVSPSLSPTLSSRFILPPGGVNGSRKLAHSNSFSIDWEAIDGGYGFTPAHEKRVSAASMALTPPPRTRRPWTAGSAGALKAESLKEKDNKERKTTPPIVELTPPHEHLYSELSTAATVPTTPAISPIISTFSAVPDLQNGPDHDLVVVDNDNVLTPADEGPVSVHTDNIPSPIVAPVPLLESSASSFFGSPGDEAPQQHHQDTAPSSVHNEHSLRSPSRTSVASFGPEAKIHQGVPPPDLNLENGHLDTPQIGLLTSKSSESLSEDRHTHFTDEPKRLSATDRVQQMHSARPVSLEVERSPSLDIARANSTLRRPRVSPLPKQLTPPTGPPPATPPIQQASSSVRAPSPLHSNSPFAERSESRTSSNSTVPSLGGNLTNTVANKRISVISNSSAMSGLSSIASGSTEQSKRSFGVASNARSPTSPPSVNSNRSSMLPPQRPAPHYTPPQPPIEEFGVASSEFRGGQTFGGKSINRPRYSMVPPQPPPSSALPPRPDEPQPRQKAASFSAPYSSSLSSGTTNVHPHAYAQPLSSPPIRPLPPTPELTRPVSPSLSIDSTQSITSNNTSHGNAGPLGRLPSLRLRLRMMSSPTPSNSDTNSQNPSYHAHYHHYHGELPPAPPPPTVPPPSIPNNQPDGNKSTWRPSYTRDSFDSSLNPPSSPIGETITSRLDAHSPHPYVRQAGSLLGSSTSSTSGSTPAFPHISYVRPLPQPQERQALSPPPRRNSRASAFLPERPERDPARASRILENAEPKTPVIQSKPSAINLAAGFS